MHLWQDVRNINRREGKQPVCCLRYRPNKRQRARTAEVTYNSTTITPYLPEPRGLFAPSRARIITLQEIIPHATSRPDRTKPAERYANLSCHQPLGRPGPTSMSWPCRRVSNIANVDPPLVVHRIALPSRQTTVTTNLGKANVCVSWRGLSRLLNNFGRVGEGKVCRPGNTHGRDERLQFRSASSPTLEKGGVQSVKLSDIPAGTARASIGS